MTHDLKIQPQYFADIISGKKTFEVRRDDRSYAVGDTLILNEFNGHTVTGRYLEVKVTYILRDRNYVKDGFCILAIKKPELKE